LYDGIDILAGALDNLKNKNYLRPVPAAWPVVMALALLVLLYAGFRMQLHTLKIGGTLLTLSVILVAAQYVAIGKLMVLPVLRPLLFAWAFFFIAALQEYLRERREREYAVREFSRFLNPHVVKENNGAWRIVSRRESRQVTLLFSDIRGFTTLSESRTPQEVVSLINSYFSRQVAVVFRNGGTLDKFIGDCHHGDLGGSDGRCEACRARHPMRGWNADTLDALSQESRRSQCGLRYRHCIHSGPAVVGFIGSEQKREYTAIGDTVNLASRIEGLTKGVAADSGLRRHHAPVPGRL